MSKNWSGLAWGLGCVWLWAPVLTQAATFPGCVDSPENPTLILGLIGAGVAGVPWGIAKLRARFNRH